MLRCKDCFFHKRADSEDEDCMYSDANHYCAFAIAKTDVPKCGGCVQLGSKGCKRKGRAKGSDTGCASFSPSANLWIKPAVLSSSSLKASWDTVLLSKDEKDPDWVICDPPKEWPLFGGIAPIAWEQEEVYGRDKIKNTWLLYFSNGTNEGFAVFDPQKDGIVIFKSDNKVELDWSKYEESGLRILDDTFSSDDSYELVALIVNPTMEQFKQIGPAAVKMGMKLLQDNIHEATKKLKLA